MPLQGAAATADAEDDDPAARGAHTVAPTSSLTQPQQQEQHQQQHRRPNDDVVRCKACRRTLSAVSPAGAPEPCEPAAAAVAMAAVVTQQGQEQEACAACRAFEALCAGVDEADARWEELKGRRPTHGGRQMALAAHKRARMELSNFLLRVEGGELDEGEEGPAREGTARERLLHDDDDVLDGDGGGGGGGTSSGAGADAGHAALTTLPSSSTSTPSAAPQTLPKRPLSLLSPPFPPFDHSSHPPKRQRKEDDPRARRLTFHPSVVFRSQTDYRPSEAFQRTDKQNYVPGRNALGPAADGAPSAFLDTSGHSLGASRFYLQKKTKRGWVSTAQAEEEDRVFSGLGEGGEGGEEGTSGDAVAEWVPLVHGERDGAKAGVEKLKGVGLETGSDVLNERKQTLGDE